MKKYLLLFTTIISTISLISCTKDTSLKPTSPTNTSILVKNYIDAENYEEFKKLFSNELENSVSIDDFKMLKDITTAGSNHSLYDIITFENGEMILIKISPIEVNGEYKIEEVIQVPDEFKALFTDK